MNSYSLRHHNIDVSIIMPSWHSLKTIDRAIQSVSNQILPRPFTLELIVIIDGLEEGLELDEKLTEWQHQFKFIEGMFLEYYQLIRNEGCAVARNYGIKKSHGNYICYLDTDDLFYSNRIISGLNTFLYISPTADIILSPYKLIEGNKEQQWLPQGILGREKEILQRQNISIPLGVMHTREIFDKIVNKFSYGFPPGIVCGEDGILWRRMADLNANFAYCSTPAGIYYINSEGQSRTQRRPDSRMGFAFNVQDPLGSNGQYLDYIKDLSILSEVDITKVETKKCSSCQKELPRDNFTTQYYYPDWKKPVCKKCVNKDERERKKRKKLL